MKKTFTFQELSLILFTGAIVSCTLAGAASSVMKKDAVSICADNMKQLVHAAGQYAADNGNTLPGTNNKVGVNWQMRLAPYLGYKNLKPGWRPNDFPLYLCPADKTVPAKWLPSNAHIAKISYCANAALIDIDNADVNVDRQRGGRRLDDVKNKSSVILFAEDHSAGNALRYGASTKCWNRGYTYEYSRQNGTLENDDAKIGYHDYKNNYAILDGSVLLLNWEETLKPINRWIVK